MTASRAEAWRAAVRDFPRHRSTGRVARINDLAIESVGPRVALGEVCQFQAAGFPAAEAEVIAIDGPRVLLMPYAAAKGLATGTPVLALGRQPTVPVGPALLGRVVDAFCRPLDDRPQPELAQVMPLYAAAINPLHRERVQAVVQTGVRVLDALLPLGRGQRMGVFSGSGIGKSSLMGMLARGVQADVNVVALIGERGREVQDFIARGLDTAARARTVLVAATAEQPAVVRARAAYTATAIAEYFRAQGQHVFLLMDSVTRFAMARREIDLAAGQPPTARGYTPSVFSAIPALCERCGPLRHAGAITAVYTVLVEGDDPNEPVADTLRASLDGHVTLSRELANEGHYPAIDVLQSVSRLDTELLAGPELSQAQRLRALVGVHRRQREMVDMGLYKAGTNALLDDAIARWPAITGFLCQGLRESTPLPRTRQMLAEVVSGGART